MKIGVHYDDGTKTNHVLPDHATLLRYGLGLSVESKSEAPTWLSAVAMLDFRHVRPAVVESAGESKHFCLSTEGPTPSPPTAGFDAMLHVRQCAVRIELDGRHCTGSQPRNNRAAESKGRCQAAAKPNTQPSSTHAYRGCACCHANTHSRKVSPNRIDGLR